MMNAATACASTGAISRLPRQINTNKKVKQKKAKKQDKSHSPGASSDATSKAPPAKNAKKKAGENLKAKRKEEGKHEEEKDRGRMERESWRRPLINREGLWVSLVALSPVLFPASGSDLVPRMGISSGAVEVTVPAGSAA